jgi:hypothetical protein
MASRDKEEGEVVDGKEKYWSRQRKLHAVAEFTVTIV